MGKKGGEGRALRSLVKAIAAASVALRSPRSQHVPTTQAIAAAAGQSAATASRHDHRSHHMIKHVEANKHDQLDSCNFSAQHRWRRSLRQLE